MFVVFAFVLLQYTPAQNYERVRTCLRGMLQKRIARLLSTVLLSPQCVAAFPATAVLYVLLFALFSRGSGT